MKTVCKQVYAKYPDFDLTDKKDFIKATVKAVNIIVTKLNISCVLTKSNIFFLSFS